MSDFDLLYNNMHRTDPKKSKSKGKTVESTSTQEIQDSQKTEISKNPFMALFSKLF